MFESAVTTDGKMIVRAALLPHDPNVAGEPVINWFYWLATRSSLMNTGERRVVGRPGIEPGTP